MRELSLFTGAGGGLLASHLLGWRTVGAVEIDRYCCEILYARQKDGHLENFPIWNLDVREFINKVASYYVGLVDVLSAGFPCQPFSVAGQQRAAADNRNMWPATIKCIRRVKPRYCFLENVPGLLSRKHRYFETILKDLAESGYDARWKVISAAEVGAPHKRDRLWIVAESTSEQVGSSRQPRAEDGIIDSLSRCCDDMAHTRSSRDIRRPQQAPKRTPGEIEGCGWWGVEPDVDRVAHGVASRVDRLKALGNGQVPAVAATTWQILTGEETTDATVT